MIIKREKRDTERRRKRKLHSSAGLILALSLLTVLPAARARLSGAHSDDGGVGRVLPGVELDDLDLDAEGAPPLVVVRGPQGRQVVANDWIIFVGSRRRVREWGEEVFFSEC